MLERCPSFPRCCAMVTITVKLFAAYQEVVGCPELQLEFPPNTPVVAVRDRLIADYPALLPLKDITRFGINLNFAEPETVLHPGDEVVLIPPVSGG